MKFFLSLFVSVVLFNCQSKTGNEKLSGNLFLADTVKNGFFSDGTMSGFHVIANEGNNYTYKTVEISYQVVYIIPDGYNELAHYIAKYTTTTKTCTACEKPDRNIKVELYSFDEPPKLVMTIDEDCDKIGFFPNVYKTTVNGCCGSENTFEIFDYKQKSIIRADGQIVLGRISKSKITFYAGFELAGYKKYDGDSHILGSLHYAYDSDEKYAIKIRTKKEYNCVPFTPEIEILSDGHNFSPAHNEYTFWNLTDKNSINTLIIRLKFGCDSIENGELIVDIPIKNGKPETKPEIYVAN